METKSYINTSIGEKRIALMQSMNLGCPGSAVLFGNIKIKAFNFAPESRWVNTHLGGR